MLDNLDSIVLEQLIKFHVELRVFVELTRELTTDLVALKPFSQN